MSKSQTDLISIVVPVYNEAPGLANFHHSLVSVLEEHLKDAYELIYCDDGSTDETAKLVRQWREKNSNVKLIKLSRNFGKESALAAGIAIAMGKAIITIDGDGQHPVESIPEFVKLWEEGAKVVIGVNTNYRRHGWFKSLGSKVFYRLYNQLTSQKLVPGSSDFRLIDREVQEVFVKFTETNRSTRGLIDWVGFERAYVPISTKPRTEGSPSYSHSKLLSLAANSFVSFTPTPLYIFGYVGILITVFSFLLGGAIFVEQLLLNDPWGWDFTGTAMLGVLLLFMVGIVLMSQGILSLYISHINNQSKQRPLYIVDYQSSAGVSRER